jgi:regulatory protein
VGSAPRPRPPLDLRAARLVAADLLSRHGWTRAELTARLRRRGAPQDVAEEVVEGLAARGHVDDAAYARQWVETRSARGYGPARLRAELRGRGVAPELIAAALGALAPGDGLEAARAAARRRLPVLRRGSPERAAARLRDYLVRRGYGAGVAARVVAECTAVRLE